MGRSLVHLFTRDIVLGVHNTLAVSWFELPPWLVPLPASCYVGVIACLGDGISLLGWGDGSPRGFQPSPYTRCLEFSLSFFFLVDLFLLFNLPALGTHGEIMFRLSGTFWYAQQELARSSQSVQAEPLDPLAGHDLQACMTQASLEFSDSGSSGEIILVCLLRACLISCIECLWAPFTHELWWAQIQPCLPATLSSSAEPRICLLSHCDLPLRCHFPFIFL